LAIEVWRGVPEATRDHGQSEEPMQKSKHNQLPRIKALVLAVHIAVGGSCWALPQGATIVNGQVSIQLPGPGSQVINASNGAIINWKQFSIGASESTQFIQPSAASAVLNRVTGPGVSQLVGQLKANGNVFLINPNGIVIGGAARIDTNSFIASTLDITDADFIAGKLRFFAGSGAGRIRNDGMITAGPGGRIALIAPDIENTGIIRAPDGQILLAAGRKLEIASLDLDGVTFEIQAPTDSVLNLGKLLAENGAVQAFAGNLRQSGEIRASRLVRDADGSIVLAGSNDLVLTADSLTTANGLSGGSITLQSANGTARVSGVVSASGSAGPGGDVRILGERVALEGGAHVDVSGSAGGGQMLVGGDFQGRNPGVQNASRVNVATGARLRADATDIGNGGRVIVWADGDTRYFGDLSAQGGPRGGNGGFAEVSGKGNLQFGGSASLGAPAGASGTLLLDPLDLIVSATSGLLPVVADEFADFVGNVVTVAPATLAAVGANVELQATRDVYIKDAIALSTPGAGIRITAGGEFFTNGSIFNNAGISTTGGAVTLRGQSISGGAISTNGGAVDLLTPGALNYNGGITSGGGMVTLASQSGSVNNASVQAGAGTIQVTGQSGVFGGVYTTAGVANITATSGSISVNVVTAGTANLTATSSINGTVDVADRVNATSSGSYVQLYGSSSAPLRLGTLTGNSGIYLYSPNGLAQASGGVLTSSYFDFNLGGAGVAAGSAAAPLLLAAPSAQVQPRIVVYGMAAPIHLAFSGSPTLGGLSLDGPVAAIGASTVAAGGSANLTSLTFSAAAGVLNVSAAATDGFANGFELNVNDGAINAGTLTFPGAPVDLTATGAVTIGTMTGRSLSVQARGAVNITSATTTGNSGIYVYTQSCNYGMAACVNQSPITAGTLTAGGFGDVDLSTYDNGDITVTNLSAGDRISIQAGEQYRTSPFFANYTDQPTTNNVMLGTVVSTGRTTIDNVGQGNLTITSLSSGDRVDLRAGTTFTPVAFTTQRTTNTITVNNAEPLGAINDFRVANNGIGNLTLTGTVDRSNSGDIELSAADGSLTAMGNLTARDTISVTASGIGAVALGQLVSGTASSNGNVTVNSVANLSFATVNSTALSAGSGNVTLSSSTGSIKTTADNTGADIVASGNVTVTANGAGNGVIGEGAFTNPLDIRSGTGKVVTLSAGMDIGSAGKPVTVDADGSLIVSSTGGQFHVAATDGTVEKSLSTIRLSASAAGIGAGNAATFTSLDLDVTANSDASVITIGDLVRSAGVLNEFKFDATGTSSGLNYGIVNFGTDGSNRLVLSATNGLNQATPLVNSIAAGTVNLGGGSGAVAVGNISARSVRISADSLALRTVTSTGITRSNFNGALPDTLTLSAAGDIVATGDLSSATAIDVNSSGGNVTVGGAVTSSGATRNTFRAAPDQVSVRASGGHINIGGAVAGQTATTVVAGGSITVGGAGIDGGTSAFFGNNITDNLTVTAGAAQSITAQAITDGYFKTVTGGTLNVAGGITGAAAGTTIQATTFNTGNLTTAGTLTINATAAYTPLAAIALAGSGAVTIDAPDGVDLVTSGSSLTAPSVTLSSDLGNIAALLTGTTSLTVNTGGRFDLTSGVALGNLAITADGAMAGAGAGSRVSANNGSQLTTFVATGPALAMVMGSTTGQNNRYTESSIGTTDISVNTAGTFGASGGSIQVFATAANIDVQSAVTGNAGLTISTGGNIALTSFTSGGGGVNAFSSAGAVTLTSVVTGGGSVSATTAGDATQHVNARSVVTLGGSVNLQSANGNILRVGAQPLQIDTRSAGLGASGTTTLSAANGSVGFATTPLLTSGAVTLTVNARDDIAVDVANTPLTNLNITTAASGLGAVTVTNSNFAGLSVTRSGSGASSALGLGPLSPVTAGAFSLTATDGNIRVLGDLGNLTSLGLNAGRGINTTGDLIIQANAGARSVSANNFTLQAGRDVLIAGGSASGDNVAVAQIGGAGNTSVLAGGDITVAGNAGSALLSHSAPGNTQTLNAGGNIRVLGGSLGVANASATVNVTGFQSLSATGDLLVQGGASDQAAARIVATQNQSITNVLGSISVLGGAGADAFAEILSSASSQSLGTTSSVTDLVRVQGGTGSNAYASIRAATAQTILSSGDVQVIGGVGSGANAELRAGTTQTVGSTSVPNFGFNDPTNAILVQAGSGGTARILAGGNQTVRGGESISVLGGNASGMSASIETTAGSQTIGTSSTNQNDPTANILIQAGTGDGAFASFKATGTQTIDTGGTVHVLANSGAGAYAEILSTTGTQTIGSTSTSSNDATGSITVRAGSGGSARIQAQGNQTIRSAGDLSVIGGDAVNLTASIQSVAGSQNIGQTGIFSNDASGSILLQAGTAAGTTASIKAAAGQTIDAGGTIILNGTLAGAFAEITTTSGTQIIGNVSCCSNDNTDSITLTGGSAAGSYAKITTGGLQTVSTIGDISLLAGAGDDSGAMLMAGTNQTVIARANLRMTGGSGSAAGLNQTAIRNTTSGNQTITVNGSVTITGGGFGSDTWIKQDGPGSQSLNIGSDLNLLSPSATPSTGVTSIESMAGGQTLDVGGAISLNNQGGWMTYAGTSGGQNISARSLAISLSSTNGAAPFAGLSASGSQSITLNGDGATPGSATVAVLNLSNAANSSAAIKTLGNLDLQMDYDVAGAVTVGSTNGQGATQISAGGNLTMVAGQLLLQGGATTASDAKLLSGAQPPAAPTGTMLISTLYGPVNMIGGAGGGAYIDPLELSIVANGSLLMVAGSGPTANTNITAGLLNLAVTAGNLSLINSTVATSTITAGTFNYFSPPPAPPPPPTNFGAEVMADLLSLAELSSGMFELVFDENGDPVLRPRRLNQCY